MDNILAAAKIIATARRGRAPLAALPLDMAPGDEAEGYRVQRALHALLLPQVGPLVGYKIGCTSPVMQRYLDIPHPASGGWLANHLAAEGKGLHAGQIVLTGSLVKTVWLNAGDAVVMELDGLGTVAANFT